jgi:hypothetical protein
LQIASGAVLNLGQSGSNNTETLVGAALQNAGTVNLLGTNNSNYGLSLQSGAAVENQAGASFNFQVNATIFSDASATFFSNAGSLTQAAGATGSGPSGESAFGMAFTQAATGSTTVEGGWLGFKSHFAIPGGFVR